MERRRGGGVAPPCASRQPGSGFVECSSGLDCWRAEVLRQRRSGDSPLPTPQHVTLTPADLARQRILGFRHTEASSISSREMYPVTMTTGLDRRRVWKNARRAEHRCPDCGRRIATSLSRVYCADHLVMYRLYRRRARRRIGDPNPTLVSAPPARPACTQWSTNQPKVTTRHSACLRFPEPVPPAGTVDVSVAPDLDKQAVPVRAGRV